MTLSDLDWPFDPHRELSAVDELLVAYVIQYSVCVGRGSQSNPSSLQFTCWHSVMRALDQKQELG